MTAPGSSTTTTAPDRLSSTELPRAPSSGDGDGPQAQLARVVARRPRVTWWIGAVLAIAFAVVVTPMATAERWLGALGAGHVTSGKPATLTVRVPPFAGYETYNHTGAVRGGGVVIARGQVADADGNDARNVAAIEDAQPHGVAPYIAYFALIAAFAAIFSHHTRRSNRGTLLRVQLVSLGLLAVTAAAVKIVMLTTAVSVLAVPVAVFAIVPTLVLDRVVGLATGILAALVTAILVPFDVGVAILLLVQAGTAGLVVAERPKTRMRAVLVAGTVSTVLTALTYPLLEYLTVGRLPFAELSDPWTSAWIAAAVGPALAMVLAIPVVSIYQLLVGEITNAKLIELEDLSNPLLKQIAEKAPGTWQHSLMMANMAEIAANAIGANGRLVRVGAYYHDLGKSLQPKYFIENLEPGETSPHDQLPPEVSCDAIFAHVTEGIVTARKAGLHERIVDFMHMHHGNGVLEYFWAKCREHGNPNKLSVEQFRYPGVPPQSRETAILAICDAVEAASRTLKKPDGPSIDSLVQRIVYGKLHLGQLDESGLSMRDLRRINDSLRETIRHANHGRIEYPWQKAQQDASATSATGPTLAVGSGPQIDSLDRATTSSKTPGNDTSQVARLDSLDRPARAAERVPTAARPAEPASTTGEQTPARPRDNESAFAQTAPAVPRGRAASTAPATLTGRERTASTPPATAIPIPTLPATGTAIGMPAAPAPFSPSSPSPGATKLGLVAEPKPAPVEPVHTSRTTTADRARPPRPPGAAPVAPEVIAFESDASEALEQASKPMPMVKRAATEVPEPAVARKRAATLPPIAQRKPPTAPPAIPPFRPVTAPPPVSDVKPNEPAKAAVPNPIDNTLQPSARLRSPAAPRPKPALIVDDDDAAAATGNMSEAEDAGDTQPRLDLPLRAPSMSDSEMRPMSLAERVDAALDDDFGDETPVIAPTKAELRALLNNSEQTRLQSYEEIERLHRAHVDVTVQVDPDAMRRRAHETNEVDPDDIEAAIELAPPARRANTIAVAKKKKPE